MLPPRAPSQDKKAFTLLELIVVIVILAVLAAIAVPTFRAVIDRSSNEATLVTLRAEAREAQALRAFDQGPWDDNQMTGGGTAAGPGVYAGELKAVRDAGKDPAPGELTYQFDGEGLALASLSPSGQVCVVGANYSSVETGSCTTPKATETKSTLAVVLSDPAVKMFPAGTSTVSSKVTAPAAPTAVSATAGNASAVVSFTPGASNGSTITSYRIHSGNTQVGSGSASPITVTGLTNGTSYTFTVTAVNAAGESPKSAAGNAVTPTVPGTILTYSAFGDNKGVLHHLGTNQGAATWSNPIGSGTVRSAVSGRLDSVKHGPNMTVDRDYTTTQSELITSNVANSWITYDLGAGKTLIPNKYTIRGRVSDSNYSLRNWKIQGSNDGSTWTDLRVHTNDTTLTGAAAWGGWDLTGNTGYRHFRILQTGLNSSNDHYMVFSEIELYGTLHG